MWRKLVGKPPTAKPASKREAQASQRRLIALLAATFIIGGLGWLTYSYSLIKVDLAGVAMGSRIGDSALGPKLADAVQDYRLTLRYPNSQQKTYQLKSAGVEVDLEASLAAAADAQTGHWPWQRWAFWQTKSQPLVLKVNSDVLNTFTKRHATVVAKAPTNARLKVEGNVPTIAAGVPGRGSRVPNAAAAVRVAASRLENSPLALKPAVLSPAISADNLKPVQTKATQIMGQPIRFTIAGVQIKATPAEIGQWLDFTDVEAEGTIELTVNGGKVLEYINKIAAPYTKEATTQVVTRLGNGTTKVLVAGQNGSDVQRKGEVAKTVAEIAATAAGYRTSLPISYAPHETINAQAYPKWILVDVTAKRLYAYEKVKLVKTILVSAGAPETPTVLGEFKIYNRLSSQDMQGPNTDGSRYYVPDVPWVQYFHESFALHGNYWRPSSYFGNINSSHGCVGMMSNDAKWVFDWAAAGTPVIIHS